MQSLVHNHMILAKKSIRICNSVGSCIRFNSSTSYGVPAFAHLNDLDPHELCVELRLRGQTASIIESARVLRDRLRAEVPESIPGGENSLRCLFSCCWSCCSLFFFFFSSLCLGFVCLLLLLYEISLAKRDSTHLT
jgi:hypothetical protein